MQSLNKIYLTNKRRRSSGGEQITKLHEEPLEKLTTDKNKSSCSICRRKGELILCDSCPKSFHPECLKLRKSDIPRGSWYCPKCLPKIERNKQREINQDERRKLKNEKRRLYRLKKKQEALQLKDQQSELIHTIPHIDLTDENIKISAEEILVKSNNSKVRYPILDEELYSNPVLHNLNPCMFNKPSHTASLIPEKYFNKIFKIWDFINTFRDHINISKFSPYQLYYSLNSNCENNLLSEVHISLLCILLEDITSDTTQDEDNSADMIKLAINKYTDKRNILNKTWTEFLRIIIQSDMFSLMKSDEVKRIGQNFSITNEIDDILIILEYLVDSAVSTNFLRRIIKDDIDKRNAFTKEINQLNIEFKMMEIRRKELERLSEFTKPEENIKTIELKLSLIEEDTKKKIRSVTAKERKKLENEKEKFLSVI